MRSKAIPAAAVLAALFLPCEAGARAKGGGYGYALAASTVGYNGGALIGAHASPYYYGPYGYAPAYYHTTPAPGYAGHGYGYSLSGYAHGAPYVYAVGAPCWYRRQPIYGTYGEVAGVSAGYVCR